MTILNFIKLMLATFRVTMLFYNEDGPGHIFKRIRSWTGIEEMEEEGSGDKVNVIASDNFFSTLLSCPYCLSGWVVLILLFMPKIVIDWLAIWGGVFLILKRDD